MAERLADATTVISALGVNAIVFVEALGVIFGI